jgi:hypothetical protein
MLNLEDEILQQKNSLSTDRLDMSFGEIMSMYQRQEIIIDPEFQRLFRWNNEQKTKFIESIILGIPIPPIFVAEDSDGRWELVDGLQRISSLLSFFGELRTSADKNNWTMTEGGLLKSLEGITFSTLPPKYALNIKRSTCRIEIIRWNSNYDMRYELFNRLNTGGTTLTDQEIRNCIFRGDGSDFNNFLKTTSSDSIVEEMVGSTEKQKEELYLEEIVLRFTTLFKQNLDSINHDMPSQMTNFMKLAVKGEVNFDYGCGKTFIDTLNLLQPLGSSIFRYNSNRNFSANLFDTVVVGIAENLQGWVGLPNNLNEISARIYELKEDAEFKKLIGSGAATKSRVKRRLQKAREVFAV